jgi:hypothetical protein
VNVGVTTAFARDRGASVNAGVAIVTGDGEPDGLGQFVRAAAGPA